MFPRQRYHGPNRWDRDSGDDVCWAVRTLAQALDAQARRREWRHTSRQPTGEAGGAGEANLDGPSERHPEGVPRTPQTPRWQPPTNGYAARRAPWQRQPRRASPSDWRDRVLPRRGPPVAVIKAPRWSWQEVPNKRQPRGLVPRSSPRGGPARSAEEPRRKPQGGLCGGPARSAKDPQTRETAAQPKAEGKKRTGKDARKKMKGPIIVTVEMDGKERRWGQLSRSVALRVGCFWEDMDREVKVFLENDGRKKEVQVEKRVEGGRPSLWLTERPEHPRRGREGSEA